MDSMVETAKEIIEIKRKIRDLNKIINERLKGVEDKLMEKYNIKVGDTILLTEYDNRKVSVVSLELVESRFFEYCIMVENKTEEELLNENCIPYSLVARCLHYTKKNKVERGRNTKQYYISEKTFKKV